MKRFFKLKSKPVFLVGICALLVITSLGIFSEKLNASKANIARDFLKNIDGKVRYLIVDEPDGFREALIAQDIQNVLNHDFQPELYIDSDLIVFFFNEWKDVRNIPGANVFGDLINRVAELKNALARAYGITANGSETGKIRPVLFIFYNLTELRNKGCNIERIAESTVKAADLGAEKGLSVFKDCKY